MNVLERIPRLTVLVPTGFRPAVLLSYTAEKWWSCGESNPGPQESDRSFYMLIRFKSGNWGRWYLAIPTDRSTIGNFHPDASRHAEVRLMPRYVSYQIFPFGVSGACALPVTETVSPGS